MRRRATQDPPTVAWRGRIRERVEVRLSRTDTAEDLMRTWGLTAEQAGDGSPDVVWLLKDGIGEAHPYAAGDRLDLGVEAFPGEIEAISVSKPSLTREQVVEGLRPLLDLPVEHMLATHGVPFDRAALEHALA